MSAHTAPRRVSWVRWQFWRAVRNLLAAWYTVADEITCRRYDRREARDQRRERAIWGDTGTTGDLHAPDLIFRFDGELTDEQYETLKAHWRAAYKRPVELVPLPPFEAEAIDQEAVPGSQTRDYWRMQLLGPPTMTDAAVPARAPVLTAAPPVSRTPDPAVETGSLPGPDVSDYAKCRAGEPDLPEWVTRYLTCDRDQLGQVHAADLAHLTRMAAA